MNRASGGILVLLVGGLLMVYTAYRSLHVVQSTLPPEAQIVGYAALAGLDGALIAWTLYKARSARGEKQNAIAVFMICLQLAGITATLIGDTVLTAAPGEATAYYLRTVTLWAVPLIIATNVAATVVVHLVDPAQEIFNAKREVRDEIERQVADHLRQNAAQIAARITPAAAEHRAEELLAEFMRQQQPTAAPAPTTVEGRDDGEDEGLVAKLSDLLARGRAGGAPSPGDTAEARDFLARIRRESPPAPGTNGRQHS